MKGGEAAMKHKIALAVFVLAVIGVGVFGVRVVSAQNTTDPETSLIQKLVDRFHLNKADVQQVFNQERSERQAQNDAAYKTYLDQLVKDGKITGQQETLLVNKHKELEQQRQSELQNWRNLTPQQRRTEMDKERLALDTWAQQNNIDPRYLMGGFGKRGHMGPGPGMGMMEGWEPISTPSK